MVGSNINKICLFVLVLLIRATSVCAQQPTITPKTGPVPIQLDATGNVTITLKDIATVTPDATNPNPTITISPTHFDCFSRGPQTIKVTATDNMPPVKFDHPIGIVGDGKGNYYVTDAGNHKIRKIDNKGNVTDFAGNGKAGYVNGPGNQSEFDDPEGITIDKAGNLYVTDTKVLVVRKILPDGTTGIFAGTPYSSTYDNQNGTTFSFDGPYGITVDAAGNFYVADAVANRIREITPTGYETIFAGGNAYGAQDGNGTNALFYGPTGITIDAAGNLYVADSFNNKIRKITPNGDVTTIAGTGVAGSANGPANAANFNAPNNLIVDGSGNIFISDTKNQQIRKLNTLNLVSTLAGNGSLGSANGAGASASFNTPVGLALDGTGNLIVADEYNNQLRSVSLSGTVSTLAGTLDTGSTNGNIYAPNNYPVVTQTVPVVIETTLKITTVYPDQPLGPCTTAMPDFVASNPPQVIDNCNDNVPAHQEPAAGTPLTSYQTIPVMIIVEDATGKYDTARFKVTTGLLPTPPAVSIAASTLSPVCAGTPVTFTATPVNAGTASYQWQVNGNNAGTNNPVFTSVFNNGDNVSCTIASSICSLKASSQTLLVAVQPKPTVSFNGAAPVIKSGSSVQMNPAVSGDIATYLWAPAYGLSEATIADPLASPTKTTTYHLTVTSANGCDSTASITVTVVDNVIVPSAFTPNGDGINDNWYITGISLYPANTVSVYDRNGSRVFYSSGYSKPWDGTYKGRKLSMGTYYYVIDLKNGKSLLSGPVTILR